MFYLIEEVLRPCSIEEIKKGRAGFVAVLTPDEWIQHRNQFEMGIDLPLDIPMETQRLTETKVVVNYDSLTGSFSIPSKIGTGDDHQTFAFALDEKGIVFIDAGDTAESYIQSILTTKKWRMPSLERFLYDFLECLVGPDVKVLAGYEERLDRLETAILAHNTELNIVEEINDIRWRLLDLRNHYEQLIDVGQELEENENEFFSEDNLRYFHMFVVRVERLRDSLNYLREYSLQLRDLYQSQLDVKQNKIMTILTVLTTVFFPLSIITGWYGMNFTFMPELGWKYSYLVVILVSVLIVIIEAIWFKKKKYW